jgi:hypothetical protein
MRAFTHLLLALFLLAILHSRGARAWTPETQLAIAAEARKLVPRDLARQIAKHEAAFARGAVAPFEDKDPLRHMRNPTDGVLDRVILRETENAIRLLREHRPFSEVVFRLGVVSHYVADANNPLNTAASDPREGAYFADYLRYLETAEPRFAAVFYGISTDLESSRDLQRLLSRTLARGRDLYPSIGREYRRIGFGSGRRGFDDRSTAFAVGALSFSHAITDIARVLRYIWLQAGGGDPRPVASSDKPQLVQLRRNR